MLGLQRRAPFGRELEFLSRLVQDIDGLGIGDAHEIGADDRLKARLERIVYEFIEEIDLARALFQHVADDVFRQVLGKLHIVL